MIALSHRLSPVPPLRRRLFQPRRLFAFDLLILLLLWLVLAHLLVTVPLYGGQIAVGFDHAWYLNRGQLFWHGIFDDFFVYNAVLPLLIGAVDLLVNDLALAAFVVNWTALLAVMLGTYLLGRMFFNRRVGLLAVLLVVTNATFQVFTRRFWPFLLFEAVLVACVMAYWLLLRYRSRWSALLLGLLLVPALYTRLEGMFYYLLVILAVWGIYATSSDWRQALRLGLIATLPFVVGLGFYFAVISANADPDSASGLSLLNLLRAQPIIWNDLSHRWMETLLFTSEVWSLIAWAVLLAGLLWPLPSFRVVGWFFAVLLALNVGCLFVATTWPAERYAALSLPFFALLCASGLWQIVRRWRIAWPLIPLILILIAMPGLKRISRYMVIPNLGYTESAQYLEAREIDHWLADQGWQDCDISTLCPAIIPFTNSNFHYLYRIALKDQHDPALWWNSPQNLLPAIQAGDDLFMGCDAQGWFEDWLAFFADPDAYPLRLQEVGRVGEEYVFYEVVAQ